MEPPPPGMLGVNPPPVPTTADVELKSRAKSPPGPSVDGLPLGASDARRRPSLRQPGSPRNSFSLRDSFKDSKVGQELKHASADLSQEIHRTFNTFNNTVSTISNFRSNLQTNFRAGGSPAELFFFSWTKFELCELLVKDGYEVRGERHVSQEKLVSSMASIYEDAIREGIYPQKVEISMPELMARVVVANKLGKIFLRKQEQKAQLRMMQEAEDRYRKLVPAHERPFAHRLYVREHKGQVKHEHEQGRGPGPGRGPLAPPSERSTDAPPPSPLYSSVSTSIAADSTQLANSDGSTSQSRSDELGGEPAKAPSSLKTLKSLSSRESADVDHVLDMDWEMPDLSEALDNIEHPRWPPPPGATSAVDGEAYKCSDSTGRHCMVSGLGEQCDYWGEGKESAFAQYGTGVVLYFKFVKWIAWVFATLSCLYFPVIAINTYGNGITNPALLTTLALTTAGNLGDASNVTKVKLPWCGLYENLLDQYFEQGEEYAGQCIVNKEKLGIWYSYVDFVAVMFLLVAIRWLREYEDDEIAVERESTVTPSDFTVYAPALPRGTAMTDLRSHFEKFGEVVDINIGYDYGSLIQQYKDRGAMDYERYKLDCEIRFLRTRAKWRALQDLESGGGGGGGAGEVETGLCCQTRREEHLLQRRARIVERMQEIDAKEAATNEALGRTEGNSVRSSNLRDTAVGGAMAGSSIRGVRHPVVAFVSFNRENQRNVALKRGKYSAYQRVCYGLGWCGGHWWCGQKTRSEDNFTIAADAYQTEHVLRLKEAPAPSTIRWENLRFGQLNRFSRRMVTNLLSLAVIGLALLVTGWAERLKSYHRNKEYGQCPIGWEDYTLDQKEATIEEHRELDYCYCLELSILDQFSDKLCSSFVKANFRALGFQCVAVGCVVGANTVILSLMDFMSTHFEKHHSMDAEEISVFIRMVTLKVLATGCIYLVVNKPIVKSVIGDTGLDAEDFSVDWYQRVSPLIMLLIVGNIFAPHIEPLSKFWLMKRRTRQYDRHGLQGLEAAKKTDGIFCQEELNRIYVGPTFHLKFRYAQIIVTYMVCMMYGLGLPVLMPIGCVSFVVVFWVDKWLFIRFYRTPPSYSHRICVGASTLLSWGVALHCGFSMLILSNGQIFYSAENMATHSAVEKYMATQERSSLYNRFTQPQVYVMTVTFVFLTVLLLLWHTVSAAGQFLVRCVRIVTCSARNQTVTRREVEWTYKDALSRGLIHGLPTYRMLMNPVWRDTFKLDMNFASDSKNKDLNELKLFHRGNLAGRARNGGSAGSGSGGGGGGNCTPSVNPSSKSSHEALSSEESKILVSSHKCAATDPNDRFRREEMGAHTTGLAVIQQPTQEAQSVVL